MPGAFGRLVSDLGSVFVWGTGRREAAADANRVPEAPPCSFRTVFFCPHHIYYLGTFPFTFSLSRRNSDPASLGRLFYPLSPLRRYLAFIFIA